MAGRTLFILLLSLCAFAFEVNGQQRMFVAPFRERVGELLIDSASADFNGDNLIVGTGGGAMRLTRSYAAGLFPADIKAVRLNGDAYFDIVVASPSSNTLTIFYGNGDGDRCRLTDVLFSMEITERGLTRNGPR
ncbi:MAG: hypothetical protein ABR535_01885 [Pyrinomonadaceae bacterium]